ncbi:MAG: transposase [Candidatus Thiodiazotropha sp. (ex Gloverina cf. vestifex)]|nr:transposase [Candidatus Thiodiazotropha sp. (ex Gloverina cf. vestifex)]
MVIAAGLRRIYTAPSLSESEQSLEGFASKRDGEHPTISRSWRNNWERLTPFFDYPPPIRKVIYTTNAIESLNPSLRKMTKKWSMPIRDWKQAMGNL